MSDEALDREQQELLKSLGKKATDFLVKISPMPDLAKEAYKVARELEKTASTVGKASATGELTSTDYSINKVAAVAKFLYQETTSLACRDENWWIENSKVNLLDPKETTRALEIFQEKRQLLLSLRETCDGLKQLALVAVAAATMNVKGIAKLYVPSLVAIDAAVTKQSRDQLDYAISAIGKVVDRLEGLIRQTADIQKNVDRFLMLVNSSDQRKALEVLKGK